LPRFIHSYCCLQHHRLTIAIARDRYDSTQ
jgi:hypothetical protein